VNIVTRRAAVSSIAWCYPVASPPCPALLLHLGNRRQLGERLLGIFARPGHGHEVLLGLGQSSASF
jgi:hypothetical protein